MSSRGTETPADTGTPDLAQDDSDQEQSTGSPSQEEDVDATPRAERTQPQPQSQPSRNASIASSTLSAASQRAPVTSRPAANLNREIEDLQTKLRLLEKKRTDDREKLKALERIQVERDRFESIIQKVQQKYQPQQQEIADLRKQIKESESRYSEIESIQADHDIELENATLDREMAEEQYEAVKAELTALKDRYEELELEVEVLRDENQEFSKEMSPEERSSQGFLQLERSNERYREALIRLRDITQEQESELKQQITALEKDLEHLSSINEEADALKVKLLEGEAAIEDLKQQLEIAQGSEEMLEDLSERNMALQDRIDELNNAIEDLESLKELNDELEVNHVEAEKQMQEEIDFKESIIHEQMRRAQDQQKSIEDYELTVARFREAFRNLQADLEDMRASKQITDTEAEDLNSKSRALLDLNLKLQTSAAKTQVKTLDLELQRLEAEEASEHLEIVRLFLPESYQMDRDSVLALLRIKRIAFKANILHTAIKERIDDARSDDPLAGCNVLNRLIWVLSMCKRLDNAINECPADAFNKFADALFELEPIERTLNNYMESMKRDELNLKKTNQELERSVAVMAHLGTTLLPASSSVSADEMIMAAHLIQSCLENAAIALMLSRSYVETHSQPTIQVNGDSEELQNGAAPDERGPSFKPFFERIDTLISRARGAKVAAGKLDKELSELRARSLSPQASHVDAFQRAQVSAQEIAAFANNAGQKITSILDPTTEIRYLTPHQVVPLLISAATQSFGLTQPETSPFSTLNDRLSSLTDSLSSLFASATDLSQTVEFSIPAPPWVQRSQAMKSAVQASSNHEAEVGRLNEILRERNLLLRTRERDLDDQSVRIETLEARMREASKRSTRIEELEGKLETAAAAHRSLKDDADRLAKDVNRLRAERDDLRARTVAASSSAATEKSRDPADADPAHLSAAARLRLEHARVEADTLRAAVRNLHARRGTSDLDWLSVPLRPAPTEHARDMARRDVTNALLGFVGLVASAETVSLKLPEGGDRLAWRPVKESGRWIAARQREEWERWREESARAVRRVEAVLAASRDVVA